MRTRILSFINYLKIPVCKFEEDCGLSNGAVNKMGYATRKATIDKISAVYPQLNIAWLRSGEGSMLKEPQSVSATNNGTINGDMNTGLSLSIGGNLKADSGDNFVPVIPIEAYDEPKLDVFEYINNPDSNIRLSPIVKQFPSYDAYYVVQGDEMHPYFLAGDKLAISPYNQGSERKLIGGRVYVVDTNTNGMMLRMLYLEEGGFRAVAHNPRYADVHLEDKDVIRIYRVLGLLRTSV